MILDKNTFIIIPVFAYYDLFEFIKCSVDENIFAFDMYMFINDKSFYKGLFYGYSSYLFTLGKIQSHKTACENEFFKYLFTTIEFSLLK